MNRPMPPVTESADDLKHQFHHEPDARKRHRLHMLYLITSGLASRRIHLARLLGRDHDSISTWVALYERGGLSPLLDIYIPAGKAAALSLQQLEQLKLRLAPPQGFAA